MVSSGCSCPCSLPIVLSHRLTNSLIGKPPTHHGQHHRRRQLFWTAPLIRLTPSHRASHQAMFPTSSSSSLTRFFFFSDKNIFTRLPGPLGRLTTGTICYILKLAMTEPDDTWTTTGYFDIERRMLPDDSWQGLEILAAAPQVKQISLLKHHKDIHEDENRA